jgi:hypothetical protein
MPCTRRYFSAVGNQLARISGAQIFDGYVEQISGGLSEDLEVAISFTEISAKPSL